MKISACLITKNAPFVSAAINSILPHVDEVVVLDTGSSDDTVDIARKCGARVHSYTGCNDSSGNIESFSDARQHAYGLTSHDCVIWMDSDDILVGGEHIRKLVSDHVVASPFLLFFPYEYSYAPDKTCNLRHYRERICSDKKLFHWTGPVHEVLIANNGVVPRVDFIEQMVWKHQRQYLPQGKPDPERNIRIFEAHIKKHGIDDPRTRFYYANELMQRNRFDEAKDHYVKYVDISGWDDERAMATLSLYRMAIMKGDYKEALTYATKTIEVCETWAEGYLAACRACYFLAETEPRFWTKCVNFAKIGLGMPPTKSALFLDPNEKIKIHEYLNVALSKTGDIKGALESVRVGIDAGFGNSNMEHNKRFYESELSKNNEFQIPENHPLILWKQLLGQDEVLKAEKFLECLPWQADGDQIVNAARELTARIAAHTKSPEAFKAYYADYCDESVPMETEITASNYLDRFHRLEAATELATTWTQEHGRKPIILDLGCQDGWISNRLAKLGYLVTGMDVTPKAMEIFERNAKRLNLDSVFILGDVNKILEEGKWDIVLCLEVLEHVVDDAKLVDVVHKLLTPDGVALFSTPLGAWFPFYNNNGQYRWDKPRPHIRAYSETSLQKLLSPFTDTRLQVKPVCTDHPDQKTLLAWGSKKKQHKLLGSKSMDVVIWTGQGVEQWTPADIEGKGLGGSETACAQMGKELVKLGHRVRVFSDCPKQQVYDGVEYFPFQMATQVGKCDILISSRQPQIFDAPIKAAAKFLWVHDVHVGPCTDVMHRWLLRCDRILCLSEWHKQNVLNQYPFLHPSKIIVTRNGIDLSRFKPTLAPRAHKMIYSSSADRGLEKALDFMPLIRERVKDAELHVYYGFEWWSRFATMGNDQASLKKIEELKKRIAETPGVVFHGRVPQAELAKAFQSARVWCYPTWFTETYCISAVEAMAAGCVPVTTKLAALAETVKSGYLVDPPNTSGDYEAVFVDHVVDVLQSPDLWEREYHKGIKATKNLGWDSLAKDWDEMFRLTIAELADNPVPKYGGEYL